MALQVGDERFEELVDLALEQIPAELLDQVENCALIIEDEPAPESVAEIDSLAADAKGRLASAVRP